MEQRPLRLGDILDDYCPRERRLTNHAIVAMIEDEIRQTRCTTCDAEHVYKGGKVPKRRKKETPAALYKEVLAGMPETQAAPILAGANHGSGDAIEPAAESAPEEAIEAIEEPAAAPVAAPKPAPQVQHAAAPAPAAPANVSAPSGDEPTEVEEGPVHRPLIRAQLPRIEGQKEERRLPEFTIRQATRSPGHFGRGGAQQRAGGGGQGNGAGNGNRPHGGSRFAGPRPSGPGRGQAGRGGPPQPGGGFRAGQPRHGGGGKKRSR